MQQPSLKHILQVAKDTVITLRTACIQYICADALELTQSRAIINASWQTTKYELSAPPGMDFAVESSSSVTGGALVFVQSFENRGYTVDSQIVGDGLQENGRR